METKVLALTEFKLESDGDAGTFEGYASRFGTIDSYGDTIDRGAYKDTIPEFLERGFLGWGHDWADPIGFFTEAREREDGLYVKGQFHSDPEAQVKRQRVKERAEAGKFMGLSIGFEPLDFEFRDEDGRQVRALTRIKLHEVSLVTVPAEHGSGVTRVKGQLPELPAGPGEVIAALPAVLKAAIDAFDQGNPAPFEALLAALDEESPRLRALLIPPVEDPPPAKADPAIVAEFERFKRLDAWFRPLPELVGG